MDLSDQMVCDLSHRTTNTFPPLQFHGSTVNVVPRGKVKKKQQHTIAMTIKQSWMDRLICWLSVFNEQKHTLLCLAASLIPHFWQFSSKLTELMGRCVTEWVNWFKNLTRVPRIYSCAPFRQSLSQLLRRYRGTTSSLTGLKLSVPATGKSLISKAADRLVTNIFIAKGSRQVANDLMHWTGNIDGNRWKMPLLRPPLKLLGKWSSVCCETTLYSQQKKSLRRKTALK